tara:strand:+ start:990 stop:1436 length:447 start_codon:yes stop_codon:yes gene_type:complete
MIHKVLSRSYTIPLNMSEEVRYWPRIGMKVSREVADQFLAKLSGGEVGSILDEDLDEFVAVVPITVHELNTELDILFTNPALEGEIVFDEVNQAILELMTFESNRKQFILDCKSEGMTMEEAKTAYETAKGVLVKKYLPDSGESEEEE